MGEEKSIIPSLMENPMAWHAIGGPPAIALMRSGAHPRSRALVKQFLASHPLVCFTNCWSLRDPVALDQCISRSPAARYQQTKYPAHRFAMNASSNAMFLVQVFPTTAAMLLCERTSGEEVAALVEKRADYHCDTFVGYSKTQIKAMVERQEWDNLKALLHSCRMQTTPLAYNSMHTGLLLPSSPPPSSNASGPAARLHRQQTVDRIIIIHSGGESPLSASSSGSTEYLIGSDKLERFLGVVREPISIPFKIECGGNRIEVNERIRLTWNRQGDNITESSYFNIVRPEYIQFVDVLLGHGMQKAWDARYEELQLLYCIVLSLRLSFSDCISDPARSPYHLALDQRENWNQLPRAPTAPPAVQPEYSQPYSSDSIHTGQGLRFNNGRQQPQSDSGQTVHYAPQTTVGASSSTTGSRAYHDASSIHPRSSANDSPSSQPSVPSSHTTRASRIVIQLSFQGKGKRNVPLDLSKTGDQVVPWLEPLVLKMTGGIALDINIHELEVTPLHGSIQEPEVISLCDLDYCWDTIKDFVERNRAGETNKGAEFRFHIT
ncbi:hypothetical protein VTL71DRAFT_11181 [Oculimacula yallundae]|uniref:Uncharacterized protein n=1 Tax=Oculimacula yallundae TaxID=86028 RepID=A0ABR4CVH0_9HELO